MLGKMQFTAAQRIKSTIAKAFMGHLLVGMRPGIVARNRYSLYRRRPKDKINNNKKRKIIENMKRRGKKREREKTVCYRNSFGIAHADLIKRYSCLIVYRICRSERMS